MSNFHFLIEEWPGIAQEAMEAERFAIGAPIASAVFARRALERSVRWLYANDNELQQPYDDQLSALMDTSGFRELVPPAILTDEARKELHPPILQDWIENRWGPALNYVCQTAGRPDHVADELLESGVQCIVGGPRPVE